ncbi:hypothetical protein H6F87_02275 [Cyanobacteria bacterium FACHB-502]|nr:hypothetical protein [Cyanobacteria bacterium FACHB-502]
MFRSLSLEEFVSAFTVNPEQGQVWYGWWSEEYDRLSWRFYKEQYNRHLLQEFRDFCFANSLKLSYPDELEESYDSDYYQNAWKRWQEQSQNLQEHWEVVECLLEEHSRPPRSQAIAETLQEYQQQLKQGWTDVEFETAKAAWFNVNFAAPSATEQRELNQLPYRSYLRSDRWRRMRAAMLLINFAKCAACGVLAESHYGGDWETEIHVHHLRYRKRGRERYTDLELLCKAHHDQEHHD